MLGYLRRFLFVFLIAIFLITPLGFIHAEVKASPFLAEVIFSEDFETDGLGSRYSVSESCNDSGYDFFTRTDGTDIGSAVVYNSPSNTYFWAAQDTDGSPCTSRTETITWTGIDISGHTTLNFSGLFAEDDSSDGNEDWDSNSLVYVEINVDGAGYQKILQFAASGTGYNTEPAQDTNFDGLGDGTALTDTFTEFTASIPQTGNSMDLRITVENLDSGDEDIAFDLLKIEDSAADTPPTVDSTAPADSANNVAIDTNIDINFSEDVTVSGSWYDIACTNSGAHTATVSGGAQNYVLNPDSDFSDSESCTVTVYAAQVADQDGTADNMAADYSFSFETAAPFTQMLILNEFQADPASDSTGDANGDGTSNYREDEFVELVNVSGADLDISGWTLSDGYSTRHIFPAGTVIPADCTIVVFGGGTPSGSFGNATVQVASSGALGLNNGGDTITVNDGVYDQVNYTYGSEGGNNQSLTLDPDINGATFVQHSGATGSGGALFSPGTKIDGSLFSGCVISSCGSPATLIHTIQGSGSVSPEVGNTHSVEGVVVGDFQTSNYLNGFFIQEEDSDKDNDPTTSEGIFVYDGASPSVDVHIGDIVRVDGTVNEFYDLTELSSVSNVEICSSGNTSSAATVVMPVADTGAWEAYEGMLVTIPQTLYVTGNYNQGHYGEVDLSVNARLDTPTNVVSPGTAANLLQALNDRSRIQLDDGRTASNPSPPPYFGTNDTLRAGDTLSGITGVVHYSYGAYELHPTETLTFTRENTRSPSPSVSNSRLKVASFNVLNYFTTLDDGSCPYSGGCRGADTAAEFTRQRDKIIAAITSMDADVIGLMEMENHPTDEALKDLVNGLNDAAGAGTYAYIDSGVIGTDVIKVAFIYKKATVSPEGAYAILDSSVDPNFNDDKNRPALAQTFREISTGEEFTAVVNHLKSKGSNCDALGDPDTGDGQGNCNLTRTSAATALVNWLNTDPTSSGDPDFIIIGDLNAYAKEDPIAAIINGGYTDLIARFISSPYSFVYMGQAGYLDHALANASLAAQVTEVEEWHINADEPAALDYNDYNQPELYKPDAYRASDHDPVIIGLNLGSPPTVLYGVNTIPANGASLSNGPTQIFVEFNQEVVSDGSSDAANYIDNYLLVETGANNSFDTASCASGLSSDDIKIVINAATYETGTNIATLNINNGIPLESGSYRLYVCGSTSILNLAGYHLNGDLASGTDSTLDFSVNAENAPSPSTLPATGFPHGVVTSLPAQPAPKAYTETAMTLEIPKLGINIPIVGVPQTENGWDVTWLGNAAGYLAGSAFPTWTGNTVITGHVWDAWNQPGIFSDLKTLGYGDQVQIHAWGQTYTYEVRESKLITTKNVKEAFQSEEYDWVTLVTCEFYNPFTGDYLFRRAVRAILVSVR